MATAKKTTVKPGTAVTVKKSSSTAVARVMPSRRLGCRR